MYITLISFILFGAFVLQYKALKNKFDIVDVHIFMSVVYFGVWPLVVIYFDPNSYIFDSWLLVKSSLIILSSLSILWVINFIFSNSKGFSYYKEFVNFDNFIEKTKKISDKKILILVFALIAFMTYSYLKFGITKAFSSFDLSQEGITLPVWFLVIYSSIRFLIFCTVAILSVKLISNKNKKNFKLILSFLLILILSLIFGRVSILSSLLVFLFFYIKINNIHFFSFRLIKKIIILSILGYLAVNFFQNIRSAFLSPTVYSDESSSAEVLIDEIDKLTINDILVPDKQVESLLTRPSVSKFNVMILDWQSNFYISENTPYGGFLIDVFKMMIPRFLWKDKPENNFQQNFLFPTYGQTYSKFQAPSLVGYTIADFGVLSFLIMPIIFFGLICITLVFARIFKSSDSSYLILFLSIFYSLISVEANYDSYVMNLRNALFFAITLIFLSICKKLFVSSISVKSKQ